MHRLQDAGITLHYGFSGTAALYDITLDDTNKAFVGICVDKNSKIHHAAQLFVA